MIQQVMKEQEVPGFAIAVVRDRKIVYAAGYGVKNIDKKNDKINPESLFHMASITKPFVATSVMQLVEQGKVDLDMPVVKYLPYFRLKDERYKTITVRQDIKVCRFTVDRPVHSGTAAFNSAEEARENDLAAALFAVPGISRVELDGYNVGVTQSGAEDWRQLGKRIGSAIRNFLNPPPEIPEGERLAPEHIRSRVQQVLDEMINPGVAAHGGFVELLDVQDDNVFIRMGGGCQGCGAADVTLKRCTQKGNDGSLV